MRRRMRAQFSIWMVEEQEWYWFLSLLKKRFALRNAAAEIGRFSSCQGGGADRSFKILPNSATNRNAKEGPHA